MISKKNQQTTKMHAYFPVGEFVVFNVPPTAKVIWRRGQSFSLIRQTGEAGNRTCDPWFTRQAVYPLHHGGSYQ